MATFGPALARVWRAISFSLVFLGFSALAFTGEIHPIAIALFMLAWGFGLFFPIPPRWVPAWSGHVLLWSSLMLIGFLALQGRFESIIYLVLFISLAKCLSLRESLDHIHVLLMSFFMLLATSIITSSITFLFFLFCFVVLVTLALICFTMGREVELALSQTTQNLPGGIRPQAVSPFEIEAEANEAGGQPGHGPATFTARALFLPLLGNGLLSTLFVLSLAFVIFFIVPHHSTNSVSGLWNKSKQTQQATSGYQDEITMNSISQIHLDHTQVMEVFARWADDATRPLPPALRLRGASLGIYDEKQWRANTPGVEMNSYRWNAFEMTIPTALNGPPLQMRIKQYVNLTSRLFSASYPQLIELTPQTWNWSRTFDWKEQALRIEVPLDLHAASSIPRQFTYDVLSNIVPEAGTMLHELGAEIRREREANPGLDPQQVISQVHPPDPDLVMDRFDRLIYQQLPESALMRRVKRLAEAQAPAHDMPSKIVQLLDWFQRDFSYSFTPEVDARRHPLEVFLFTSRRGHCEYFATALTLLLRAQGIPARIVSGYYTSDRSSTGAYVVKQSDAHAWTEVWLDGYGWLTVDPTPPAFRGSASYVEAVPSFWSRARDSIRLFWQQYILDFSASKQEALKVDLLTSRTIQKLMNRLQALAVAMGTVPPGADGLGVDAAWDREELWRYGRLFLVLGLLVILLIVYRQVQLRRRLNAPDRSPVVFMNDLLRALERQGFARRPHQTPAEWIAGIEQAAPGRWELDWIVELYQRLRFGHGVLQPEDQARIKALLQTIQSKPGAASPQ